MIVRPIRKRIYSFDGGVSNRSFGGIKVVEVVIRFPWQAWKES